MHTQIKIPIDLAILLYKTKKQFICYSTTDNKIVKYTLTNDLQRWSKVYTNFKTISCIKHDLKTITI